MGKFAALIVLGLSATAAVADEITSVYSDLDLKTCKALELYNGQDNGEGGVWECKGIEGFDVLYLEGDLRGYVAFGPEARSQCTSAQTFGAFNSPGPRIEWRMENGKPIATILRWFTDNGSGEANAKQNWLTVTKLNGKDEAVVLTPPIRMSLEKALAYVGDDELVEITPKSIRLRKTYLDANERKRMSRAKEAADVA